MARATPLTYEGALRLLGGHSPAAIEALEKITGAGILLGAIVVPGALGLVDGKQEAGRLLHDLAGAATARLHGTHGHGRHELVTAAHTTIVLAALFDALHETIGPSFAALDVTDREKLQLASAPGEIVTQADWIARLAGADLPLPGPAGVRTLMASARTRAFGRYQRYEPAPPDVVAACAAWIANLVVLGFQFLAEDEELSLLAPPDVDPQAWWSATVRLWQAGLTEEALQSMPLSQSQSQGRGLPPAA